MMDDDRQSAPPPPQGGGERPTRHDRHAHPVRSMPSRRSRRRALPASVLTAAIDIGALWLALSVGATIAPGPMAAFLTAVVLLLAVGGSYRPRVQHGALRGLPGIALSMAIPAVLSVFSASAPVLTALPRRLPIIFLLFVSARAVLLAGLGAIRSSGMLTQPTLIVGGGEIGVRIATSLLSCPRTGLVPVGFLDTFEAEGLPLPLLGDVDALERVLSEFEIRRVIIAYGRHREAELVPVLRACRRASVSVHAVPRFFELDISPAWSAGDGVAGIPLVHIAPAALRSSVHSVMRGLTPALSTWDNLEDRLPGKVSVVIPAVNEARNITWVLERVPEFVHEIVLVDGSSDDDTVARAMSVCPRVRVITEARGGKGAALRVGFAEARGDYIVMLDADGSMDPAEIGNYLDPLLHGYEFVKGSRCMDRGGSDDLTAIRHVGNWGLTTFVNVLFGARFTDLCYGFSAFRRDCLPALDLRTDGFEIETEMTIHALKANLRIAEVASYECARRNGQSNLRTFRDGTRVLRTLVRERIGARGTLPRPTVSRRLGRLDEAFDRLSA